jgi:hypothetical protein
MPIIFKYFPYIHYIMSEGPVTPLCDEGLEKKVYESQCADCDHKGSYKYRGDPNAIHFCDYYHEVFLKKLRSSRRFGEERKKSDTAPTKLILPFEPPHDSNTTSE